MTRDPTELPLLAVENLAVSFFTPDGVVPAVRSPAFDDHIRASTTRRAAVAAGVLISSATLVVSPMWGAASVVPAALIIVLRRARPAAMAAAALTAALGALVAWRQLADRHLPDAAWPGWNDDLHHAGMFVVALLLAGTLDGDEGDGDEPDPTAIDTNVGTR